VFTMREIPPARIAPCQLSRTMIIRHVVGANEDGTIWSAAAPFKRVR
jgi:hypothetical protein